MTWARSCLGCGGTGDLFDRASGQWGEPGASCPDCGGTGSEHLCVHGEKVAHNMWHPLVGHCPGPKR